MNETQNIPVLEILFSNALIKSINKSNMIGGRKRTYRKGRSGHKTRRGGRKGSRRMSGGKAGPPGSGGCYMINGRSLCN